MARKVDPPLTPVVWNEGKTALNPVERFRLDIHGTDGQSGFLSLAARIGTTCYLDAALGTYL